MGVLPQKNSCSEINSETVKQGNNKIGQPYFIHPIIIQKNLNDYALGHGAASFHDSLIKFINRISGTYLL